jgi:hypothetical protein
MWEMSDSAHCQMPVFKRIWLHRQLGLRALRLPDDLFAGIGPCSIHRMAGSSFVRNDRKSEALVVPELLPGDVGTVDRCLPAATVARSQQSTS